MLKLNQVVVASFLFSMSVDGLFAQNSAIYSCDSAQSLCEVYGPRFTIGDKVGFFNSKDELLAIGSISKLKGTQRSVQITQKMGRIAQNSTVELIEDERLSALDNYYDLYRKPKTIAAGFDFGYSNVGLGEGGAGLAFGFDGTYRLNNYLSTGARAAYLGSSGVAIDTYSGDRISSNFSTSTYAFMPIIRANISGRGMLGARAEFGFGAALSDITTDLTQTQSNIQLLDRIDNGWSSIARASAGLVLNMNDWQPSVDVSVSSVQKTSFRTISIGLSRGF